MEEKILNTKDNLSKFSIIVDYKNNSGSIAQLNVVRVCRKNIEQIRRICNSDGFPIPRHDTAVVFSMGPNKRNSRAILKREAGMLSRSTADGVLQFFQGELLTVTMDYVISRNDMSIKFD